MSLEELRIVRETAECLRARPDSGAALRRRNEWIKSASARHPLNQVAAAAGLPPHEVDVVLQGAIGEDLESIGHGSAGVLARFRSSPA